MKTVSLYFTVLIASTFLSFSSAFAEDTPSAQPAASSAPTEIKICEKIGLSCDGTKKIELPGTIFSTNLTLLSLSKANSTLRLLEAQDPTLKSIARTSRNSLQLRARVTALVFCQAQGFKTIGATYWTASVRATNDRLLIAHCLPNSGDRLEQGLLTDSWTAICGLRVGSPSVGADCRNLTRQRSKNVYSVNIQDAMHATLPTSTTPGADGVNSTTPN